MLALFAWWALARNLPEFILPGPVAVARRLIELFVTPEFLWHAVRLDLAGAGLRLRRRC